MQAHQQKLTRMQQKAASLREALLATVPNIDEEIDAIMQMPQSGGRGGRDEGGSGMVDNIDDDHDDNKRGGKDG